ncbi:MAG: substrate-binding domain-containing protein, partial [Angustibacter sp.]
AVPEWDNVKAGTIFEQMYTAQQGRIDGVLAANDGLGGAAIAVLEKNQRAGKVAVTGQDATPEGLQRVLAGTQCMTVYKSAKQEAGAVAQLAIALSKGEKGTTTGEVEDKEGNRKVPSVLLNPQSIDKSTVKDVITDGGADKALVCKGEFAKFCTENGIS